MSSGGGVEPVRPASTVFRGTAVTGGMRVGTAAAGRVLRAAGRPTAWGLAGFAAPAARSGRATAGDPSFEAPTEAAWTAVPADFVGVETFVSACALPVETAAFTLGTGPLTCTEALTPFVVSARTVVEPAGVDTVAASNHDDPAVIRGVVDRSRRLASPFGGPALLRKYYKRVQLASPFAPHIE